MAVSMEMFLGRRQSSDLFVFKALKAMGCDAQISSKPERKGRTTR